MYSYTGSVLHLWGIKRYIPDEDDHLYLWDGEADLTWMGATWLGMRSEHGVLLEIGGLHSQQGLPDSQVSARLSIAPKAHAMFWAHDFTGLEADVGNIYSLDSGRTWAYQQQRRRRGRISRVEIENGVVEAIIASHMDDIDRGIVVHNSDSTQRDIDPEDTGYSRKAALAEGINLQAWPN